jgi:hypothetical protein
MPGVEIELQYLYRKSDGLLVPAELAGFALAESLSFEVVDSYYDTPTFALRRAGSSLRVRRQSNLPHPILTWKGPSEYRPDGAKQREEVEIPLDHVPASGEGMKAAIARYKLWEVVGPPAAVGPEDELDGIGVLRNRRSSHLYVHGMHRFELTWDRLTYPVGEPEVRLEVEAKRKQASRFFGAVDAELREIFGKKLVRAPHGKSRELVLRMYPDAFDARAS